MTYEELDINQRINLKGALVDWTRYATQHFQESLEKKLYRVNTKKRGAKRTGNLRNRWWQNVQGLGSSHRIVLEFLLYGRFQDIGVGRGTDYNDRLTARRLRMGSPGRTPRRWYAKKKGYELHRLREILAARYVSVPVQLLENALTLTLPIPL
ncbi:hypothetical protein [Fibrivirga algicola]|uniref:Uncharacterized protein n=1 Tax=Fibrivirga algicola TaxID=2950420 RepID=A0ABX0QPS1_9BACT|nr:hypothetical protein [Fibrivirga algicola]NID13793.1 hypothetical protein [Fibrivirga algicola]